MGYFTKIFFLFVFASTLFNSIYGAGWDTEYWQYFSLQNYERGKCRLYTSSAIRFNKSISQFYYSRVTGNFAYHILPDVDLGIHYSFIYTKPLLSDSPFSKRHRFEFEGTSSIPLKHNVTLKWRNRFELTKHEEEAHLTAAFRCQLRVIFPLKNAGNLTKISCFDEVFYHFRNHRFTQNRLRPIELIFTLNSKTSVIIFVMIRNFFSSNKWHRSIDLGSELAF